MNSYPVKETRTPLNVIAYNYVCEKIIRREFYAGMPLVESDLAESLGISRTPVREALKRLEEEGLVRSVPDRGSFVAPFTMQDVTETVELRIILETAALKSCIESVTDADIQECREILASISEHDDLDEMRRKDSSLHDLITKYCTNKRMLDFLETIKLQQERLRWSVVMGHKRVMKMKKSHLMLLGLIEQRDYKKTSKALTKHLSEFYIFIDENYELLRK